MEAAVEETGRRREIQRSFNDEYGAEPTTIQKPVGETSLPGAETDTGSATDEVADADEAARRVANLEERMEEAANNLEFELAADIRDRIRELREEHGLGADDDAVAPGPEEF
jgi:excinuclease ABC subunit B